MPVVYIEETRYRAYIALLQVPHREILVVYIE